MLNGYPHPLLVRFQPKIAKDDAFWFPHAASQAGPVTNIQELLWPAMENSFQEKTIYPIGNGPFIDGLPIKNGGSFHGYVSHNQMVYHSWNLSLQHFGYAMVQLKMLTVPMIH